jgi:hypothetical protein
MVSPGYTAQLRTPSEFEDDVRRLARELWPASGGEGPVILQGRERDGIFITPDTIHLLEATTDRRKAKATKDIEKCIDLKRELQKNTKYESHNFKIWFITKGDPSADQVEVARTPPFHVVWVTMSVHM